MIRICCFLLLLCAISMPASAWTDEVSPARIEQAARDALRAASPAAQAYELTRLGELRPLRVPAGALDLAVEPIAGRWPRPRVAVTVEVRVDGDAVGRATVWFAVSAPVTGLVHAAAHSARQVLTAADVASAEVDLAKVRGTPVGDPGLLSGLRLRRGVRAGQALVLEDFEALPEALVDDALQVVVRSGSIRLRMPAQVLSEGRIGDVIRVMPSSATEAVEARLIEDGVAEIVL